jgi:hypothetical protein
VRVLNICDSYTDSSIDVSAYDVSAEIYYRRPDGENTASSASLRLEQVALVNLQGQEKVITL